MFHECICKIGVYALCMWLMHVNLLLVMISMYLIFVGMYSMHLCTYVCRFTDVCTCCMSVCQLLLGCINTCVSIDKCT